MKNIKQIKVKIKKKQKIPKKEQQMFILDL